MDDVSHELGRIAGSLEAIDQKVGGLAQRMEKADMDRALLIVQMETVKLSVAANDKLAERVLEVEKWQDRMTTRLTLIAGMGGLIGWLVAHFIIPFISTSK